MFESLLESSFQTSANAQISFFLHTFLSHVDEKFPHNHKVILLLNTNSRSIRENISPSRSSIQQEIVTKQITSKELPYTHGPVNGSLYAMVARNQAYPTLENSRNVTETNVSSVQYRNHQRNDHERELSNRRTTQSK